MANLDTPHGLRPVGSLYGAPYSGGTLKVAWADENAVATFIGDMVILEGASDAEGNPTVDRWEDEDTTVILFGVVVGFDPDPANLSLQYRSASTARTGYVVPCTAGQLFVVQADADIEDEDIGTTADLTDTTGNTTTGLSGMELSSTSVGSGLNVQIMGLLQTPDNSFATNAEVVVRVNENAFSGVGVAT